MDGERPSVEGIYDGRINGYHVLLRPKLLEDTERTLPLDGYIEVPRENVLFIQVLSEGVKE